MSKKFGGSKSPAKNVPHMAGGGPAPDKARPMGKSKSAAKRASKIEDTYGNLPIR